MRAPVSRPVVALFLAMPRASVTPSPFAISLLGGGATEKAEGEESDLGFRGGRHWFLSRFRRRYSLSIKMDGCDHKRI